MTGKVVLSPSTYADVKYNRRIQSITDMHELPFAPCVRDFQVTAEPSGEQPVAPAKALRFVIQKHAATRLHYDFRLELDGTFRSWAVTRGPSLDPGEKRLAVDPESWATSAKNCWMRAT